MIDTSLVVRLVVSVRRCGMGGKRSQRGQRRDERGLVVVGELGETRPDERGPGIPVFEYPGSPRGRDGDPHGAAIRRVRLANGETRLSSRLMRVVMPGWVSCSRSASSVIRRPPSASSRLRALRALADSPDGSRASRSSR